eukprot:5431096-Prymnesium_polylepis.1
MAFPLFPSPTSRRQTTALAESNAATAIYNPFPVVISTAVSLLIVVPERPRWTHFALLESFASWKQARALVESKEATEI